jgi:rsbT co-antagonist protein RsbR
MENDTSQGRMAAFLRDHQDKVVGRWSELVAAGVRGRSSAVESRAELEDLYTLVLRVMSGADEHAGRVAGGPGRAVPVPGPERVHAERDGARPVFSLKEAVYELIADAADLVPEYLAFSRMVDDLGLRTFETYAAAREQIITDQATTMLELSTPVVRLWDGIIAVPLVGTLDSARTQLVMEKLLETLVATGADHAVIDITGVPTVDTEVAQHLLKTVNAARLLGAECTVCGIRPQVAQTIVSLGIEFGDIATKATLADALRACPDPLGPEGGDRPDGARADPEDRATLFVSIQIDLQDESVMRLQEDLAEELSATGCERRDHRHHRGGDRRLLHRPDADHDRVDLPAVRRRDGHGRHAPGGGDHADRAGTVPAWRAHRSERREGPGALNGSELDG